MLNNYFPAGIVVIICLIWFVCIHKSNLLRLGMGTFVSHGQNNVSSSLVLQKCYKPCVIAKLLQHWKTQPIPFHWQEVHWTTYTHTLTRSSCWGRRNRNFCFHGQNNVSRLLILHCTANALQAMLLCSFHCKDFAKVTGPLYYTEKLSPFPYSLHWQELHWTTTHTCSTGLEHTRRYFHEVPNYSGSIASLDRSTTCMYKSEGRASVLEEYPWSDLKVWKA